MMDRIIGHKKVLDFFEKAEENKKLSHAYCFVGPAGVGKRTVAECIAAGFFGKEKRDLSTHPDFRFVAQLKDEKTGKTKKDISIDQLKEVRAFLSQRPFLGQNKIVIIDNAERMNVSAANALLKTLEEPPEYATLFLVTTDESRLPSTIQSRCQTIFFHPVGKEEIFNYLKNENIDTDIAHDMVDRSGGLPGRAFKWAEDVETYEWYKKEIDRFKSLSGESFYKKIKTIEDLFGDKSDHIAARQNLHDVLDIWQIVIGEYGRSPDVTYSMGWTGKHIVRVYDSIEQAKDLLGRNIHPRLVMEHVILQLP